MDRPFARRRVGCTSDEILSELSTRQFVRPHRPTGEALAEVAERLGACPDAAARALAWLDLDPAGVVGRLTRTQLAQLALSVHRFCRQSAEPASMPVPAPLRGV